MTMSGGGYLTAAALSMRVNLKRLNLALVLLLVAAPPAAAQQDGVFVDPDSPAGKEYAVPLDQARDEASGGGGGGSGKESLFGEGIEPVRGGSAVSRNSDRADKPGSGSREGDGDSRERDGTSNPAGLGQSSAAIEAAAADGSNGLLSAGIAAAVLALGLLCGLGLRRLLRT